MGLEVSWMNQRRLRARNFDWKRFLTVAGHPEFPVARRRGRVIYSRRTWKRRTIHQVQISVLEQRMWHLGAVLQSGPKSRCEQCMMRMATRRYVTDKTLLALRMGA